MYSWEMNAMHTLYGFEFYLYPVCLDGLLLLQYGLVKWDARAISSIGGRICRVCALEDPHVEVVVWAPGPECQAKVEIRASCRDVPAPLFHDGDVICHYGAG